ncbi:MAG: hypothetical protein AAF892_11855 [Cyanobacteria bacterium P01_D01_bin.71]
MTASYSLYSLVIMRTRSPQPHSHPVTSRSAQPQKIKPPASVSQPQSIPKSDQPAVKSVRPPIKLAQPSAKSNQLAAQSARPAVKSAQPAVKSARPAVKSVQSAAQSAQLSAPLLTIICDTMILLIAVGLGLLLHALVVIVWPATATAADGQMLKWIPFGGIISIAAWYLLIDLLRCGYSQAHLPFNYPQRHIRRFYWERLELILSTIAASLLLMCLCLLMPGQPLISKVFLAAVAALIAFAVRQTIPSRRQAFAASTSVFSLAMMMVAIASIVTG